MLSSADLAVEANCAPTLTQTSDVYLAHEALMGAYAPHRLEVVGDVAMDFRMLVWDMQGFNFAQIAFGTDVQIVAPPPETYYVVLIPLSGHCDVTTDQGATTAGVSGGAIVVPTAPVKFTRWTTDCRLFTMRLQRSELENTLAAIVGRPLTTSVRFGVEVDLAAKRARPLLRAIKLLRTELDDAHGLAHEPAMLGGLVQLVMTGLLLAQPHNYSDEMHRPVAKTAPRTIRNAVDLIRQRANSPVRATDLANAAGLSLRALEEGFQRHIGMSPMQYLRETRLEFVHRDLKAAAQDSTTVAATAHRWGFTHVGRFSAAYQHKYGVKPSATLRSTAR